MFFFNSKSLENRIDLNIGNVFFQSIIDSEINDLFNDDVSIKENHYTQKRFYFRFLFYITLDTYNKIKRSQLYVKLHQRMLILQQIKTFITMAF